MDILPSIMLVVRLDGRMGRQMFYFYIRSKCTIETDNHDCRTDILIVKSRP